MPIPIDKGDLNRWIRSTNAAIRSLRKKIATLLDWLKEVKQELSQPQQPNLGQREFTAWKAQREEERRLQDTKA